MSGTIVISVTGGEICSPVVPILADLDPTGATVSFGVSADTATAPSSYTAGSWAGSWTAASLPVNARTPTLGATGATINLTAGQTYVLWAKVATVGGETPAGPVATIRAT